MRRATSPTWSARRPLRSDTPLRETRWGSPWLALAALLAGAAAIRLVGVRYGLPFPLLNPDEESIVPRAWRMSHGGGLDPGWFDYPTLLMYMLAPFQNWSDEPSYLVARLVVVTLGSPASPPPGGSADGLTASWRVRRRGGTAVATVHVAVLADGGHRCPADARRRGLARPARPPAVIPAGIAIGLDRELQVPRLRPARPAPRCRLGSGGASRVAAALAPAAFLAASPYFAVHLGDASTTSFASSGTARRGWLGFEDDPWTPFAFIDRLWEGIGPALLIALAGLVLASSAAPSPTTCSPPSSSPTSRRWCRSTPTSTATSCRSCRRSARSRAASVACARDPAPAGRAARLVDPGRPGRSYVPHARRRPRLDGGERDERRTRRRRSGDAAPDDVRVLRLAQPGPGRKPDPGRNLARLRELDVGYVLVTGAVADRVLKERGRYPVESRFYMELDREGNRRFSDRVSANWGPWVAVYEL